MVKVVHFNIPGDDVPHLVVAVVVVVVRIESREVCGPDKIGCGCERKARSDWENFDMVKSRACNTPRAVSRTIPVIRRRFGANANAGGCHIDSDVVMSAAENRRSGWETTATPANCEATDCQTMTRHDFVVCVDQILGSTGVGPSPNKPAGP